MYHRLLSFGSDLREIKLDCERMFKVISKMAGKEFYLISGRDIKQGSAMEKHGKLSEEYAAVVSKLEIHPDDLSAIGVSDGNTIRISSAEGSVIGVAKSSTNVEPSMVFIAYGPWSSVLSASYTHGTGMPDYKSVKVTVEKAEGEKVPTVEEVVKMMIK